MDTGEPDPDGGQLAAVQQHLRDHTSIQWVWYDYWSMPQDGERSPRTLAEKREFEWMLQNISLLFLSMPVLILLDISYRTRFWTNVNARRVPH